MFCGFGAVVLLVLLINTDTVQARNETLADLRTELVRVEYEVVVGKENLQAASNSLEETNAALLQTRGETTRVQTSQSELEIALADSQLTTSASRAHVNRLKSDLKELDKTTQRLAAEEKARVSSGAKVHEYRGEGDRQYLSGLKLGGERTLILLDTSASMLDETLVNVIRLRNMDEGSKRNADKWVRARNTAEWLIANLPVDASFALHFDGVPKRIDYRPRLAHVGDSVRCSGHKGF